VDALLLAVRVILSLGAVVALLWVIQRRMNGSKRGARTGDVLNVVSRRGLGQKSSVVVVETDGKRFLLGVTEHSVNVLHTSDAPAPEAVEEATPENGNVFALKLAEASAEGAAPATRRQRQALRPAAPQAGSFLSADTWRQAAAAARKGLLG
jgi:flagellar protein FliO/FliZ